MRKIWVIFLFLCIFLIWCDDTQSTKQYSAVKSVETVESSKHKTVYIKYLDEYIDVYWLDTFDTSFSSFIDEAYYDSHNETLIMNLTWTYYKRCNLPKYIWDEFRNSGSLWWYFNSYIKWQYDCVNLKLEAEKAEREAEMQRQQAEFQRQKCESLRNEANAEIAEIRANKLTSARDNMNAIQTQIQEYKRKLNNVRNEAMKDFKWDVPEYVLNARINNLTQQYKQQLNILEWRYYSSIDLYNIEEQHNRKMDELILQWQQLVVNEWC